MIQEYSSLSEGPLDKSQEQIYYSNRYDSADFSHKDNYSIHNSLCQDIQNHRLFDQHFLETFPLQAGLFAKQKMGEVSKKDSIIQSQILPSQTWSIYNSKERSNFSQYKSYSQNEKKAFQTDHHQTGQKNSQITQKSKKNNAQAKNFLQFLSKSLYNYILYFYDPSDKSQKQSLIKLLNKYLSYFSESKKDNFEMKKKSKHSKLLLKGDHKQAQACLNKSIQPFKLLGKKEKGKILILSLQNLNKLFNEEQFEQLFKSMFQKHFLQRELFGSNLKQKKITYLKYIRRIEKGFEDKKINFLN